MCLHIFMDLSLHFHDTGLGLRLWLLPCMRVVDEAREGRDGCLENGARKRGRKTGLNVPVFLTRFRDPTWAISKTGPENGDPGFLYFFLQVKHAKLFFIHRLASFKYAKLHLDIFF